MQIHKNHYYLLFMLVLLCIVVGYSGTALWRWYGYVRLSTQTTVKQVEWRVIEQNSSSYVVAGKYQFVVKDRDYTGETEFFDDSYLNQWSAEQGMQRYQEKKWTVWYQPGNENYSSLQKKFPLKECLSALVLWGLWFYFFWLGVYVAQKKV